MGRGAAIIAGSCALLLAAPASAQGAPFGARGQLVISTTASAGVSWTGYDTSTASIFNVYLGPSADYFFARNVSIGADAYGAYSLANAYYAFGGLTRSTSVSTSGALRIGANVPLGRWVSFYPRLSASFAWGTEQIGDGPTLTTFGPTLTFFAPVLFHLRSHLFVGFGPSVSHAFDHVDGAQGLGGEATNVQLYTILGGYVGGDRAREAPDLPIDWPAFGAEHTLAFDGAAGASWSSFEDGSSQLLALSISAGLDYFVLDHFSLGTSVFGSYSRVENIDPVTGSLSARTESWSGGFAPRIGYDVPFAERFSFYPRVALGLSLSGYDAVQNVAENRSSSFVVYVSAYAPVLWHVAPHFFVGFGPVLAREVVDQDARYQDQNRGTTVGASLTIGGWLRPVRNREPRRP